MKNILYSNVIQEKLGNLRTPLHIIWSLTYRCNQRCLYCQIWKTKTQELNTKGAFSIIDELSSLGTKVIYFSGGEPLLRDDLGEIIDYAHKKSIPYIDMNSNGTLVKTKIKQIKDIRLICLTLDGPEKIHDRLRGQGTYRKVLEGALIAKKNKIRVYFRTVLTKFNLNYIDNVLNIGKKMDIKVIFQPVTSSIYGTGYHHSLSAYDKELLPVIKELLYRKQNGDTTIDSPLEVLKYIIQWPKTKRIHCLSGRIIFHLGPDGKFYPCPWERDLKSIERKDALKLGVAEAIKALPISSCQGCNNTSSLGFIYHINSLLRNKIDFKKPFCL